MLLAQAIYLRNWMRGRSHQIIYQLNVLHSITWIKNSTVWLWRVVSFFIQISCWSGLYLSEAKEKIKRLEYFLRNYSVFGFQMEKHYENLSLWVLSMIAMETIFIRVNFYNVINAYFLNLKLLSYTFLIKQL